MEIKNIQFWAIHNTYVKKSAQTRTFLMTKADERERLVLATRQNGTVVTV
jgi:hypothetical protein